MRQVLGGNRLYLSLGGVVLALAGSAVPARAATASRPQTIATGKNAQAKLSANGRWALISMAEGERTERLYLWHVGESRARPVGSGGSALAVTDDGRKIAYRCGGLFGKAICLAQVGRPGVRHVPIPCDPETLTNWVIVSGDLSTALIGCQFPLAIRLLSIRPHGTNVRTIFQTLGMTGPFATALSDDGSTAVFQQVTESEGAKRDVNNVYVYRNGLAAPLAGVEDVRGVSRNGRYLIGTSAATRALVRCGPNSPALELKVPVIVDTLTGARRELPSLACAAGSWAVADDGRMAVAPVRQLISPLRDELRLARLNLASGVIEQLPEPTSYSSLAAAPQLAGGTLLYGYQAELSLRAPENVLVEMVGR